MSEQDFREIFGENLSYFLELNQISRADLARMLNVYIITPCTIKLISFVQLAIFTIFLLFLSFEYCNYNTYIVSYRQIEKQRR